MAAKKPNRMLRAAVALDLLGFTGCLPAEIAREPEAAAAVTRGLDPGRMRGVVDAAQRLPRLQALIVARHGQTLAEHRLRGPTLDRGEYQVGVEVGAGGAMLFVVPELALTVVMISDPTPAPRAERHLPALHALLDSGIIPAAIKGAS